MFLVLDWLVGGYIVTVATPVPSCSTPPPPKIHYVPPQSLFLVHLDDYAGDDVRVGVHDGRRPGVLEVPLAILLDVVDQCASVGHAVNENLLSIDDDPRLISWRPVRRRSIP